MYKVYKKAKRGARIGVGLCVKSRKAEKAEKKAKKVLTIGNVFGILSKHLERGGTEVPSWVEKIFKKKKKVLDNGLRV